MYKKGKTSSRQNAKCKCNTRGDDRSPQYHESPLFYIVKTMYFLWRSLRFEAQNDYSARLGSLPAMALLLLGVYSSVIMYKKVRPLHDRYNTR